MKLLLTIWWRAFSIVTLTAMNVTQVSQAHYVGMFFTGSALSFVWWMNTRTAAASAPGRRPQIAYAFGAGCGTIVGAFLGGLLR